MGRKTMIPENTWLFYTQAAWNIDQAAYITRTLIDNPANENQHAARVIWASAYKYSIVSYCSPFMQFDTSEGKANGLSIDFVPIELRGIHIQVKEYRHKILAHTHIKHLHADGFNDGYRIVSSGTYFEAPAIGDAFKLFSTMSDLIIRKRDQLDSK